jgi:hypothetical protein
MAKNSRTVFQRPNLVRQKIDKELSMGRIADPFINPPFPTFRVSPIGLVQKKDGDFRMIHNLSHPMHNSVNDFIDSEFCLGMRTLMTPLKFSTALHWCTENRSGN